MPNVLPFRLPKSPLNDCTGTKRRILRHPCPPRPQNRLDPLRGRKPRSETRSPQESRRHPIEQHLRGEARREEGSPTCVNYAQAAARPRVREPILPAALRAAPSHLWEGGFCFLAPSYLPASRIGSRAWIMVHIFWERQTPKRSRLQLRAASLPFGNRDHFFFFFSPSSLSASSTFARRFLSSTTRRPDRHRPFSGHTRSRARLAEQVRQEGE